MSNRIIRRVLLLTLAATVLCGAGVEAADGSYEDLRRGYRLDLLNRINRDRSLHGLDPVELDAHASKVADDYCQRQIKHGTTGHFTLDGLTPYMRYSFAGGNDGIGENTAAWSANYRFSSAAITDLLRKSQQTMMEEQPPDDGHRRTILDPDATHVGIGIAWLGGELRMAQELIRRYIEWGPAVPRRVRLDDRVDLTGRPLPGVTLEAITVHHEPVPSPLSRTAANRIDGYRLPDRRHEYRPRPGIFLLRRDESTAANGSVSDHEHAGHFTIDRSGAFSFTIPFNDGPGIYTVVVWVRRNDDDRSIAASNISIRVERNPGSVGASVVAR